MPYANPDRQRRYARYWIKLRRKAWLAANGPCRVCGSSERLELHHIDRTTKETHNVWSWSTERREAELAKCEVLCHGCHLDKTREQRLQGKLIRAPYTGPPRTYRRRSPAQDARLREYWQKKVPA